MSHTRCQHTMCRASKPQHTRSVTTQGVSTQCAKGITPYKIGQADLALARTLDLLHIPLALPNPHALSTPPTPRPPTHEPCPALQTRSSTETKRTMTCIKRRMTKRKNNNIVTTPHCTAAHARSLLAQPDARQHITACRNVSL